MKRFNKSLLCLLLVLLLAAAALTGCTQTPAATEAPKTEALTDAAGTTEAKPEDRGDGSTVFYLVVTDKDGGTASYAIHTDADTVGAALYNLEMISGENGLYDTVCGKTLSWNDDHMYWAFYIGEEYATTGLDETVIIPEGSYSLVATAD